MGLGAIWLLIRTFLGGALQVLAQGFAWAVEHWKIVVPIVAALLLAWYVHHLQGQVTAREKDKVIAVAKAAEAERRAVWSDTQAQEAERIAKANAATIVALQAELARQTGIAVEAADKRRKTAKDLTDLQWRIDHAPASQDGPIPVLLCDVLNQLRGQAGADGPACVGGIETGEGGGPAQGAAGVRTPAP